jgi:Putative zinc-finger
MDERSACAEIHELLPELAAGVAAGDERARALRHLSGCADCRRELAAMATVVDELLTLVPSVQPPSGFEQTVLARVAPPRRRWWQRPALRLATTAVLAMAAAAAGAAVTMQATAEDRRVADAYRDTLEAGGGQYLTARPFTAPDGSSAGRVFAYQGTPSWVFLVVQHDEAAGPYRVHLLTRDGRDQHIGELDVTGGQGAWGGAIDVGVAQIAGIWLCDATGPALTAEFH